MCESSSREMLMSGGAGAGQVTRRPTAPAHPLSTLRAPRRPRRRAARGSCRLPPARAIPRRCRGPRPAAGPPRAAGPPHQRGPALPAPGLSSSLGAFAAARRAGEAGAGERAAPLRLPHVHPSDSPGSSQRGCHILCPPRGSSGILSRLYSPRSSCSTGVLSQRRRRHSRFYRCLLGN